MDENKCLLCLEVLTSKYERINDEIKSLYCEMTAFEVSDNKQNELNFNNMLFLQLEIDDDQEAGVCVECKKNLVNYCSFMKFITSNRDKMGQYLSERKFKQQLVQQQDVHIKVEEEVFAEDYQIAEPNKTVIIAESDTCYFCKSSDALGVNGETIPKK